MPPVYEAIVAHHVPGETVVVASTLALGALVAQERHQIPTVSVHLQPSAFRSYSDPSRMAGLLVGPRVPRWLMKLQWAAIDRWVVDPLVGPGLNAFSARSSVCRP